MPTYEYEREDGTRFEKHQTMADDPLETDPETGQKVRRVFAAPNVGYRYTVNTFTSYRSRPKDAKKVT